MWACCCRYRSGDEIPSEQLNELPESEALSDGGLRRDFTALKGYRGSSNSLLVFADYGGGKLTDTMFKFTSAAYGPGMYLISPISVLLRDVRLHCRSKINFFLLPAGAFCGFPPAVQMKRFH